jgi:alkanesulfonate monooxygenase SsuD/methylene tetrahydromethanopterin reductase-like flavin-dependent oxidoreductase (luciferase family)
VNEVAPVKIGALLSMQRTDWAGLRDAALSAERAGWDSVWVSDHLLCAIGPAGGRVFEGWTAISALGALTSRPKIGLMVCSNTFRHPALVAKMAVTLDHITGGRAVLGMGSGWFEEEHRMHGIEFEASPGARIDRLAASVSIIRGLIDGDTVDHESRWYSLSQARHEPRSVQPHLPILIGGEGPRKTLRLVAEQADMWNAQGSHDRLAAAKATLAAHCAAVGRDPRTIEQLTNRWIFLRDDAASADEALERTKVHQGLVDPDPSTIAVGTPADVADALRPVIALGFRHLIVNLRAPWDHETIARMPEVRDLLRDTPAS